MNNKARSFIKYSGETRCYTIHELDMLNPLLNPYNNKSYEYVITVSENNIEQEINKLIKSGLINKPKKLSKIICLSLVNHNSFVIYARREWKIDLLKKEHEMNDVYASLNNDDDSSDDENIEYIKPDGITIIDETNNNTNDERKISLLIIKSDSDNDIDDVDFDDSDSE